MTIQEQLIRELVTKELNNLAAWSAGKSGLTGEQLKSLEILARISRQLGPATAEKPKVDASVSAEDLINALGPTGS